MGSVVTLKELFDLLLLNSESCLFDFIIFNSKMINDHQPT